MARPPEETRQSDNRENTTDLTLEPSTRRQRQLSSQQPQADTDPELITEGQRLHTFIQSGPTLLRHIRGGRQSLERLAQQHPPSANIQFPLEWSENPKLAGQALKGMAQSPKQPLPLHRRNRTR